MSSSSNEHSSLELVYSTECSCVFNSGKKKRCLVKLVKVPARDVVRRSSHAGLATLTAAARRNTISNVPFVACGANLEVYECNLLGKKKQRVFNLRKMESVVIDEGSSEELSKKKSSCVLKIKFNNSELFLYFESRKTDAEKLSELLKTLKKDCDQFFRWKTNPQFTINAAFTECYEVTVISNLPGVDSSEMFEMKILLECILLLRRMNVNSSDEASDAVVKFWPIMSIINFGCHASDNHLFAIEYAVSDSATLDLSECVFRSAYATLLVKSISARIEELCKVQPEHVYTEVARTKRMSVLDDLKKNQAMNGAADPWNDAISEKSGVSSSSDIKPPSRNYDLSNEELPYTSTTLGTTNDNNTINDNSFMMTQSTNDVYDGLAEENSGGPHATDDGPIYHVVDCEAEKQDTHLAVPFSNYPPPPFDDDNCYASVDIANQSWEEKMENEEQSKKQPKVPSSVPNSPTIKPVFEKHGDVMRRLTTSFKTSPPSQGAPLKADKKGKRRGSKSNVLKPKETVYV